MAGIFEQAGYDAMTSTSRVTAPEKPAADLEKGMSGINYMPKGMYEGRVSIADVVRKQDKQLDLYQNPVRTMRENNPEKDIYASLLNYEFMN